MERESFKLEEGCLPVISQSEAIEKANAKIKEAMVTKYPGLISRWSKVNEALGGSFRFKEITYIAGASGSGKSYILNMLREDFAGELNHPYPNKFKILAFTFEMGADDEIIRTYSSYLKTSYSTLISSYKKISREYYDLIEQTSKNVDNDIIYYVEVPGNRDQIFRTIDNFKKRFPDHRLVITLDHTLLMEYLSETGEVELVANVARLALLIKKRYGAMVIMLGQLNDKIEQPDRIRNPLLHYPKKTDIHGSKSIYMAADTIIILHRPELLQIEEYGLHSYPAKDLIAWHFLKSRLHGKEGLIRMKQDFERGNLIFPYDPIVEG